MSGIYELGVLVVWYICIGALVVWYICTGLLVAWYICIGVLVILVHMYCHAVPLSVTCVFIPGASELYTSVH